MSSGNRRKLRLNTVTVDVGCSSSCRRPRMSSIFRPKPKSEPPANNYQSKHNLNFYKDDTTTTTATARMPITSNLPTYYSNTEFDTKMLRAVQGFGRIGSESMAVEMDSDDLYLDFRQSMLQMILANEIYSKEDLKPLVLSPNSCTFATVDGLSQTVNLL